MKSPTRFATKSPNNPQLDDRRSRRRHALEIQVLRTIHKFDMMQPGDHVLVAVSGGPDSTALLVCLNTLASNLQIKLSAAHLNHHLRGEESEGDEAFVQKLCAELGISCLSESIDIKELAASRKENLEEAAREARYKFFRQVASRIGADKIALGHTLNDQAETVLMRLIRGSGNEGLVAIRPVLDNFFVRPLLECRRREIVDYLGMRGVAHREDSSNQDLHFLRNRTRIELIPYLEKHYNPQVLEALARHAGIALEISEYVQTQAQKAFESIRSSKPGAVALQISKLLQFHPAIQRMILRYAVEACRGSLRGILARHIEDLRLLCEPGHSGRRIDLPGKLLGMRQFNQLILRWGESIRPVQFSYQLPLPGKVWVPEAAMEFRAVIKPRRHLQLRPSPHRVCLDADTLPDRLIIRSRRAGDRYGSASRKKVKKLLIAARIPSQTRDNLPMLAAGDVVVWIAGLPPAKSHRVRADTVRCLILEAKLKRP